MKTTEDIRQLAERWVGEQLPQPVHDTIQLGLPEWDDRYHCWRVALVHENSKTHSLGELQIDSAGAIRQYPAPTMVMERLETVQPEVTA